MVNFIYVLFAILLTTPLMGGDVSSRVNLTEGTMDDEFILSVEVEGSAVSTPQVPDSYQGIEFRSMGRSSSYSNINGVSKNLVTYNYKMDFEKPGSYTVPSIFVKVDSALRKLSLIHI